MKRKVRIAYIEDHRIVKEGVCHLLGTYPGIEVVDSENEDQNINAFLASSKPDVLIVDLQLYGARGQRNGFEVCAVVSAGYPAIGVIAHTMYDSVENANRFFSSGGLGFVSKKSGHAELVAAIRSVRRKKRYLCHEMRKKVRNLEVFLTAGDTQLKAVKELFTKKEMLVLELVAHGLSTKQIAQKLKVSEKTVETHRKHLFDKARVKNVAELIAFAYQNRMLIE